MIGKVHSAARARGEPCRSLFGWLRRRRGDQQVWLKVKRSGAVEELDLDCGAGSDADVVLARVRDFLDQPWS